MDHERKSRMKEATNELASLISFVNLGSEEMPIEEYVQLVKEEIVDVEFNMVELVNLTWGREIHLGLQLNECNGVDDQPTPIVKLPQAQEYTQLLPYLSILQSLQF